MKIHIACCIDDNFAPCAAALLHSAKTHLSKDTIVHLVGHLSELNQKKISELASEAFQIRFISEVPDYSTLPISQRFSNRLSEAAFWRIALPELLPDLDKVLYLDSDIIIVNDLAALWQHDVSKVGVGAVNDPLLFIQEPWKVLDMRNNHYFNSGVMLVNLDYWRCNQVTKQLRRVISENPEWEYNDQHGLNKVLDGSVLFLDDKWNVQTQHFLTDSAPDPAIVHFTGFEKPWHLTSAHPYTATYRAHLAQTAFYDCHFELVLDDIDHQIITKLLRHFSTDAVLVIWGAGMRGRRLYKYLALHHPNFTVKYFIDAKLKGHYEGVKILDALPERDFDALVIATYPARAEIIERLPAAREFSVI